MAKFSLPTQAPIPTPNETYNNIILGAKIDNSERIVELDIDLLDEIDDQPFRINHKKIEQYAESIKEVGLLEPIQVHPKENGRYDILAGRHRVRAYKQIGLAKIKCVIKNIDDNTARLILLKTNTDRDDDFLPSELAKAYCEQEILLQKSGKKGATTSEVAERNNTNRMQIHRYKRLNQLTEILLAMVDEKKIPVYIGAELSYLDEENQNKIASFIQVYGENTNLNAEQVKNLRELQNENNFPQDMNEFFNPPKAKKTQEKEKKKTSINLKLKKIKDYIPGDILNNGAYEEYIIEALQFYQRQQER